MKRQSLKGGFNLTVFFFLVSIMSTFVNFPLLSALLDCGYPPGKGTEALNEKLRSCLTVIFNTRYIILCYLCFSILAMSTRCMEPQRNSKQQQSSSWKQIQGTNKHRKLVGSLASGEGRQIHMNISTNLLISSKFTMMFNKTKEFQVLRQDALY